MVKKMSLVDVYRAAKAGKKWEQGSKELESKVAQILDLDSLDGLVSKDSDIYLLINKLYTPGNQEIADLILYETDFYKWMDQPAMRVAFQEAQIALDENHD